MCAVHANRQFFHALRRLGAPPPDALGETLDESFHHSWRHDRDQHQEPDEAKDRKTGFEEVVQRDGEDEADGHPAPTHLPKRWEEDLDAIALEDQVIANEDCDSAEGDEGEQL